MRSNLLRSGAVIAGLCTSLFAAPAAFAGASNSYIVGGEQTDNPSVVQLKFGQADGTYGCTGEVISSEWVLTARHCTEGDTWMDVYFSNDVNNPGTPIAADKVTASSNGDVALVHLSSPTDAPAMQMADSYYPTEGDKAVIQGYGLRADQERPDHLYKADVNVLGESIDAFYGSAIHVQGDTGASNHGDSGGPITINGEIVGVCSTGDSADPGADTHAGSNYANLTNSRDWIKQTAGV